MASSLEAFLSKTSHGFEAQYRAGLDGAIVLDRSHRAVLLASGKDRESFLHNMLSGDVRNLGVGAGRAATFLTNKGKMVADILVFKDEERFLLEVEAPRLEPLAKALDRYIISEDVTLESAGEATLSFAGPTAGRLLASLLDTPSGSALDEIAHLGFVNAALEGAPARVTARRDESSPRFDVAVERERASLLVERVIAAGALPASDLVRETRRIEAGAPRFGVDMDENDLPLEASLDEAISFDKGCYIGQEYIVRLAHRGHLNRRLSGLRLDGAEPPEPGTAVTSETGNAVGHITSAAYSPTLARAIALGWLRREVFDPGTVVRVGTLGATVSPLPFVNRSS